MLKTRTNKNRKEKVEDTHLEINGMAELEDELVHWLQVQQLERFKPILLQV